MLSTSSLEHEEMNSQLCVYSVLPVFDLQENQPQFINPMHYWRTRLMVLLHVKPPPRQCLFIYVNLSQCVPAVTTISLSKAHDI